jgi:hypothetical protein
MIELEGIRKMVLSLKHLDNKIPNIKSDKNKNKKVIELSKIIKDKEVETKKDLKKINHEKKIKTLKMIEDWKDVMYETGSYTQDNKTFTFTKIKYEEFGFRAHLHCPKGLSFKTLETILDKIEDGLHCIFIYNKERLDLSMDVRIVTKITKDIRFSPPKTQAWEIYIGNRFDGTPIIIDLNKWCQVLLSGTTGGGKSKLLDCIMATQVYNHVPKDLWLFLIQLDKCDLLLYKDAEICKGFADNIDDAIVILEFLELENKGRTKLVATVKQKGLGGNITDYNRIHKENKQTTIWIALDEMASMAEESSDDKTVKEKKQRANNLLRHVAQYGRSNNIFLISCLQRPTADLVSPFLKGMSNLKVSFRQTNSKSSEISMDDSSIALDLPERIAVYKTLSYDFLQTPFIDDPLIMSFIESKLKPNHKTIFDDIKKPNKNSIIEDNSGKQDISYELKLKEKEQEILEREKALKKESEKLEKDIKKNNEVLEQKIAKFKLQRDNQQFNSYDKVIETKFIDVKSITDEKVLNTIVEENKKNIEGWVEWTPPKQTGKEKL